LRLETPRRAVLGTVVAALTAATVFLLAPPMGTDLSAQAARGDFFARHGAAVLDLGWYGGTSPYGYSLLTPAPMTWLGGGSTGPRLLGAFTGVLAAVALVQLLVRTGARRPLAGGLLGVVGIFGNLVSGRVTFAVGVAFGLAALLALTSPRAWVRRVGAVAGAVLAAAASPVAGLFVGLAGAALILGCRDRSRQLDGVLLGVGAAVPTFGMALLFGTGGPMNISALDAGRAITASLLVAALVPRPVVRAGALLAAAGVLLAALLPTPVGLNAIRLAAIFALPVLAGYAVLPGPAVRRRAGPALLALLIVVAVVQPPVSVPDLIRIGDPTVRAGYFRPLLDELSRRGTVGRIEVVPTENFWEAAYVPGTVPLARGWLRQADIDRNPIFFDGSIDADRYARWLDDNAVALVAIADAKPSWVGRREAELIRAGLPYLTEVWRGGAWTLYEVSGRPALVTGATLVSSTDRAVTVDVPAAGDVLIRVPWSRWLALRGPGCLSPAPDGWTTLRATTPGRYRLSSALESGPRC
jgi:hypothetical protein